ncbi:cell division protein ZipA [Billgrantia kenyensis]|uniref:Cell division protein ZipA n=1 Tax=Billgrantia kenyensis TaxID=321266 RepID=A0A7V9VZ30_9GAMM|nr:cell division protein ZipA [Halomonas kenyensis]MBA2778042.1 cell division protein ZipA [Halomonas kenyensis]MCG6661179.1 cell division protein ZipA [Halomonas kenyensis]
MELREWLIILGLALVTLIVIDGVRRLKRQRRVPRLDQVGDNNNPVKGQEEAGDDANWELPNGGARVVKPASYSQVQTKPKLERQEHPGPSRVLAGLKGAEAEARANPGPASVAEAAGASAMTGAPSEAAAAEPAEVEVSRERVEPEVGLGNADTPPSRQAESATPAPDPQPEAAVQQQAEPEPAEPRREPTLSALDDAELEETAPRVSAEPLAADPDDHDTRHDEDEDERYRLVDLEGMGHSIKSGSLRMGQSVQRFGLSMQQRLAKRREQKQEEKARREKARAEKAALEAQRQREAAEAQAAREAERRRLEAEAIEMADDDDPLFAPPRARSRESAFEEPVEHPQPVASAATVEAVNIDDEVVRAHPTLARALRHNVSAERARETLSQADEIIVISVLSRDDEGFSGEALLDLMLACGLRYSSDMGIFHRFETEDPDSELQFSMVNVLKPGTFPIEAMDEFRTPGVTLLMPLPGALDTAAAFEAMVETAMVIVRNLGGELKDENHSVMTAQTVEFARQRVQEFERRNRLNRYQVN